MLTNKEKERTLEIILYYFFKNKLANPKIDNVKFWQMIKTHNDLYDINNLDISKIVNQLFQESNAPTPLETFYLLKNSKLSVRHIQKITGFYFKQQESFKEDLNKITSTTYAPKISNILFKKSIKKFLLSIIYFADFLVFIDNKTLNNLFS